MKIKEYIKKIIDNGKQEDMTNIKLNYMKWHMVKY